VQGRVEGRLAERWLAAFAAAEPQQQVVLGRVVGNVWVSEEVEQALVEAFRTRPAAERRDWYGILGAIWPVREDRVRLVFEQERGGEWRGVSGGDRSHFREVVHGAHVEPRAARLAASLAVELLGEPGDAESVRFAFDVLRKQGTLAEVPALRAHAANRMVAPFDQRRASELADLIERRAR
jgi:hypothetical protein